MNAQIAEGLIAHWSFDGDLQDPIGDNHGTILNDATYEVDTPTGIGQALLLPGGAENNGVQVPGADLGSNPFTMSYWIKPTTETANAGLERITSRGGDQFETGVGDAGAVGGTTSETGTTLSYYAGAGWQVTHVPITINEWTHVTWVVSTESTILYINGEEAYTGIGATEDKPGTNDLFIGTRHNSVEGFEGLIDDVRIWNRPLTEDEIAGLSLIGGSIIIYNAEEGTVGNQNYTGSLGMDFELSSNLTVTELGVFDSSSDGLALPITVELWERDADAGVEILATLDFDPDDEGVLEGGHRFKPLPQPINLPAGSYTIVAYGYGAGEPNVNAGGNPAENYGLSTNDADGKISFVGGSRYGSAGEWPGTNDGGPTQRYGAGAFKIFTGGGPRIVGRFEANWDDEEEPEGTYMSGVAAVATDEDGENPSMHITDAVNGANGAFTIEDFSRGAVFTDFEMSFRLHMTDSTCCGDGNDTVAWHRPADGMSINIGNDLPDTIGLAEEGSGSGIRICFDTWDSGGGEAPA
ncbi:MAG: LamG domain-containing protein, partial [Dehalococcoidia bacterium]|nr:LamG domain-containing protein [Dehalococcoidia bacterium]